MKKILQFIGVMALTLLALPTTAQHFTGGHVCGVRGADAAMVKAQMMQNREEMRDYVHQRGAITYVPMKIHLVANAAGEGRVAERNALRMLCDVNEIYLQHEIQFYISNGFNYFNHNNTYQDPTSTSAFIKLSSEKVNNAVNVFLVLNIDTGGDGNTLAYYQPPVGSADWIVVSAGSVLDANVLAHELGHFFSLSHPFYGWENNPYDAVEHGNPLFSNYAPSTSVPGLVENDRADQSNCTVAADGICDTPPDYLFGFTQSGCGEFQGQVMDWQGDLVDPMENNMMSYFGGCPVYEFTPDQVDAINISLESSGRNYINPGTTPGLDEINSVPTLTLPVDESTVQFSSVTFNWDAVPGATHYLFEIDRLDGFGFMPRYITTTNLSQTLTDLENDRTYYWRVLPFSDYRTCAGYSEVHSFMTSNSSAATEIASVENWLVRPNPVAKNANVVIEMNTNEAFDADVKVYSLTGQLLSTTNNTFANGASTLEVNTSDLNTGMYIISVQSAKGVMTQKVVVR